MDRNKETCRPLEVFIICFIVFKIRTQINEEKISLTNLKQCIKLLLFQKELSLELSNVGLNMNEIENVRKSKLEKNIIFINNIPEVVS